MEVGPSWSKGYVGRASRRYPACNLQLATSNLQPLTHSSMRLRFPFHYAWIVAAITFLTLLITAAVRSAPGVFIVPLEQEFHWSRAWLSAVVSVNLVLYGLIGPFAAGLIQRFGARKVMTFSLGLLAIGLACTPWIQQIGHLFFLWGVLVGCGTGMTAIVLGATIVHSWFDKYQGAVLGVLTASSATGQLGFVLLLAHLTSSYGWRVAVLALAGVLAIAVILVFLLMRDSPAQLHLQPFGGAKEPSLPATASEPPIRAALDALRDGVRSRDFWLLAGSFFVCGASTNGLIGTHLIPACVDHGFTEVQGAGLLTAMAVCDLIGTTMSGWLSDRMSNRWLLFVYYGLRGFSLLLLPWAFDLNPIKLPLFAIFYGLDWIATVPPTVALVAKIFGRHRVGLFFGWIFASHQIGAACASWFAGVLRSVEGTYDHAFMISGNLCIVTALAVLFIRSSTSAEPAHTLDVVPET